MGEINSPRPVALPPLKWNITGELVGLIARPHRIVSEGDGGGGGGGYKIIQ